MIRGSASFLAIGHVARDEFPDGTWRLGGSALYAAATAARLGLETALVTRVGPHEQEALEQSCGGLGVRLHALQSLTTTTFVFRWDDQGRRILRLRSRARGITAADVPAEAGGAEATLLGSIAHELGPDLFRATPGIRVLAAQGQVRSWDADGTVHRAGWPDAETHLAGLSAVVLSEEDVDGTALPSAWSKHAPVVLTLADSGARLYQGGAVTAEVPAFRPAEVVDATGAGDAFAAGLTVALAEGRALPDAMAFANAVASFCVEGPGTDGLASRERVLERLGT
ncbi:MAG: PfkB family carbohydrate kinase [Candidatus Limnocylindria bacterium]